MLAAVVALGCHSRRAPHAAEVLPVLPAGQESLFSEMLGGSEPLPGDCRLAGANVTTRQVTGRYQCGGTPGEVVVELHHPATAPPGSTNAGALSVYARTAAAKPLGLFDAVLGRVRARAPAVRWQRIAPYRPPPRDVGSARGASTGTPRAAGAVDAPRAASDAPASWSERLRAGRLSARWVCLALLVLGIGAEVRRRMRARAP